MKKIIVALLAAVSVLQVWGGDLETAKKQGLKFSDDGTILYSWPEDVKEVVVPQGVKKIHRHEFSMSVKIKASVNYTSTFVNCSSLTNITIPNSVEDINDGAFAGVASVKVAKGNPRFANDEKGALIDIISKRLLYVPVNINGHYTVSSNIKEIGGRAFCACTNLTTITIPNSVEKIGNDAFNACTNLTTITIPDSVKVIGRDAFSTCVRLTSITIPNNVEKIDHFAFSGCTSLTNITIPNSVEEIGRYAFQGCKSLKTITIPDSVKEIGRSAFLECTSLTSITIPNSVKKIGWGAFSGCTNLKSITIPKNLDIKYVGLPKTCKVIRR